MELEKIQTLETGYSKNYQGFTLLELLIVLLIIGIASSVIVLNTNSIDGLISNKNSIDNNLQTISEESILSGKVLGWFPSDSTQNVYVLDAFNNIDYEYGAISFKNSWGGALDDRKIFKGSDGEQIELEENITAVPLIIFYPSGENTGGELLIFGSEFIQKISINQNGRIYIETESK